MEPVRLIAALSGVSALAALGILVLVCVRAEVRDVRGLADGGAAATAVVAVATFTASAPAWSSVCAALGFLFALLAATIAFATPTPLSDYIQSLGASDEQWWLAFEREFRRYTRRPTREQNPLQAAVTRRRPANSGGSPVIRVAVPR